MTSPPSKANCSVSPTRPISPANLLYELGIEDPRDIDVEAIAQHCGATIVYAPLKGCAACILGYGDRAIITIDSASSPARRRFSGGHELGHWMHDRGKAALACTDSQFTSEWFSENPEKRANRYAADLLMPVHMFQPRTQNHPISFHTVEELANTFQTSTTATAIRLVEYGSFPSMVLCSNVRGRTWFTRSDIVPRTVWPHESLGRDTVAFGLHRSAAIMPPGPTVVNAAQWINHPRSNNYTICEDSVRITPNLVLTLLWWKDERQVLDLTDEEDDESEGQTRYDDFG